MYFILHTRLRMAWLGYRLKDGPNQRTDNTSRETSKARRNARPYFPHVIMSAVLQLRIWVFLVMSI